MLTQTFQVTGMTCGHCVAAVTEEISRLDGVRDVAVHLETGRVEITSETPLDVASVRAAVDEAGYELVA